MEDLNKIIEMNQPEYVFKVIENIENQILQPALGSSAQQDMMIENVFIGFEILKEMVRISKDELAQKYRPQFTPEALEYLESHVPYL